MRFLLHAKRLPPSIAKGGGIKNNNKSGAPTPRAKKTQVQSESSSPSSSSIRAWGQQCSPSCGCVVRFESHIDPRTQNISEISYHAKVVVTDEKLQPIVASNKQRSKDTAAKSRPLLKECTCTTLHTLAKQIVHQCQSSPQLKSFDKLRNAIEFEDHRSSLAFQHSVLREHALELSDTHCFDVVEEAFTSMIRGYMPQKRMQAVGGDASPSFTAALKRQYAPDSTKLQLDELTLEQNGAEESIFDDEDSREDRQRRRRRLSPGGYGTDRNVSMSTSQSAWSFLRLENPRTSRFSSRTSSSVRYDDHDAGDEHSSTSSRSAAHNTPTNSLLDLIDGNADDDEVTSDTHGKLSLFTWETYVDEIYRHYDEKRRGREQSA